MCNGIYDVYERIIWSTKERKENNILFPYKVNWWTEINFSILRQKLKFCVFSNQWVLIGQQLPMWDFFFMLAIVKSYVQDLCWCEIVRIIALVDWKLSSEHYIISTLNPEWF